MPNNRKSKHKTFRYKQTATKIQQNLYLSPKHFGNHKVIDLETRNKSPGVSHVGLGVPKPVLAGVS